MKRITLRLLLFYTLVLAACASAPTQLTPTESPTRTPEAEVPTAPPVPTTAATPTSLPRPTALPETVSLVFTDDLGRTIELAGPAQAIAVTMVEWTGPGLQVQVVPWTRINDAASAAAFADAIIAAPRSLFGGGTSISGAVDYTMTLWRRSPYHGARRVIDISGDGSNNRGRPASLARDDALRAGVSINGLPILALDPLLDRYYETNVIGGPGDGDRFAAGQGAPEIVGRDVIGGPRAFVIAADSYNTFAAAIRRKLILEISMND